jgi:catechol 2,3-dioxygenase-like lactoylglutathione lyase family enzyme
VRGDLGAAKLRITRPTDRLEAVERFWRDGLGFERLAAFEDHEGFDGVMLGARGAPWHLEFTSRRGRQAGGAPSPEHLLVFYLPDVEAWREGVQRLRAVAGEPVQPDNPFWGHGGVTFADPDGYRVTLMNAEWGNP